MKNIGESSVVRRINVVVLHVLRRQSAAYSVTQPIMALSAVTLAIGLSTFVGAGKNRLDFQQQKKEPVVLCMAESF